MDTEEEIVDSERNKKEQQVRNDLIRITPDVKQFILKILDFVSQMPIAQNPVMLARARTSLLQNSINSNPPTQQATVSATIPSTLKEINFTNTLTNIRNNVKTEINKSQSVETKEVLTRILQKIPESI